MWLTIKDLVPFGYLFAVVIGAVAAASSTDTCNPKSCSKNADNEKAVCGSDGLSYPNRCHFERARCHNKNMTLVRRGACRQQRPCKDWESFKISNPQYSFIPNCRPDGTYDAAQCHKDTGYCWCVTPEGSPLPYTSVKQKPDMKHRCGRKKKTTRRRSPSRKNRNRPCKQADKAIFNNNLINIFHIDYSRDTGMITPLNNETDTKVIAWKFQTLDINKDGKLDKTEYKDIKKVVKKAVKPKRCAKSFATTCDVDNDQFISRQEWADCLTRDGMDDGRQNTPNYNDDSDDYEDPFAHHQKTPPDGVLNPITLPNYDDESPEIGEDDPTDCLTDRKTALAESHSTILYVPECTPDGRYQKVQCYKSAGYCWCAHEDTGKNIPGTSVKNGVPKCDQLTTVSRPMKGCPDEKKVVFLRDLIQFLHTKMSEVINSTTSYNGLEWIASKEEKAATYSFVFLDKNQNKMLEKSEWKAFKEMVSNTKGLKKCGKKLPRYCDINKDRQISMTEWLDCLNVQQGVAPSLSVRNGKKSTLSLLMED